MTVCDDTVCDYTVCDDTVCDYTVCDDTVRDYTVHDLCKCNLHTFSSCQVSDVFASISILCLFLVVIPAQH
jgi:hypothetical protein